MDLAFDPAVNDSARTSGILSESHRNFLAEKARNIEKYLPPFSYDITPREEHGIQIDRQFFEVFRYVFRVRGELQDILIFWHTVTFCAHLAGHAMK